MRIISGSLKGKSINFIRNLNTRPLKDLVRENIFNILKHSSEININIEKALILDLYSGVGSFGIECLSRGAQKVTFLEHDNKAVNMLKDNLINLSIINKADVYNFKVEQFFEQKVKEKYDIFFFDPPFKDNKFSKYLDNIKKEKIFKKKHIIIIHREKKTNDNLSSKIKIIKEKIYGRSKIIFGVFN